VWWSSFAEPRRAVAAAVALGAVTSLLLVAQAWLLAVTISGTNRTRAAFAALLAVVLLRAATAWLSETVAARCSARAKTELRSALLARAVALRDRSPGAMATLATREIDALDAYFARFIPQVALAVIVPLVVLVVLVARDWISAAIVVVTVPLIPLFMALVGADTRARMDAQVRSLQRLGGHFLDVVAGLTTLKVFGRAKAQAAAIETVSERHRVQVLGTLKVAFLSSLVLELLATISMALIAVAVGLRLMGGHLDFETALLVLVLAPEAYLPLRRLGESYHAGAEGAAAGARVKAVLDEPLPVRGTRTDIPVATITVEDAFSVEPGEIVALTGPSGCGKTTLLRVLLGLEHGTVTIGGVDLHAFDPAAWHARIAWVPQHPHLFAGTIADNVRLGAPDATPQAVRRALADAQLADIDPETRVGDRGAGLSAGERQRLALARAFLRDAPLLLLDEPTAGLDGATEAEIVATIRRLVRGRTVVLVAHRPALVHLADRVIDLAGVAV
jgi:ATP-binding cassette, subfamily C, bacterial CydCD